MSRGKDYFRPQINSIINMQYLLLNPVLSKIRQCDQKPKEKLIIGNTGDKDNGTITFFLLP
jgi:hypothetical protein